MRNLTEYTHIHKKNAIYLHLSLVLLCGLILILLRGLLHPVYIKSVSTYQTSFSSEQVVKKEVLEIVSDSASTEKELVEEAVNLKQEKRQEVAILTYYDSVQEPDLKKELNYKAETTDEGVKITNFYHNANTVSDTALSKRWDVSKNNFDLMTGVLTIQLTIKEGLSKNYYINSIKRADRFINDL